MGLWHQRLINTQLGGIKKSYTLTPSFFSKKYTLHNVNELALSSESYTTHKSYNPHLYVIDDIYIAIDGEIDELGHNEILSNKIFKLYKMYGNDGLYQLKGRFSLILYDAKRELTFLFRSFFTGHPLYFVAKNNILSVATNPVYLLHRPDVSDILDNHEINAMFSLAYTELKGNIFSQLTLLESGEMVIISPDNIEHIKKPLSSYFVSQSYSSESDTINRYLSMVKISIDKSITSDVEYGIMLSSGMDSSTIAALAKQTLEKGHRNFRAYSWTLPNDPSGDESIKIKALAKSLNIPLKLFNGENFGPFDILENHTHLPDTPYMNPYRFIVEETYRQANNDGIDVLFNGGYGDLLYFGRNNQLVDIFRDQQFQLLFPEIYFIIKNMGLYNGLKNSVAIRNLLKDILPTMLLNRLRDVKKSDNIIVPEWLSQQASEQRKCILDKKIKSVQEDKYERFKFALMPYFLSTSSWERYLSGNYGIQRIDPFHNFKLLNYTSGIPSYMTYRKGQTKYFAREAMSGLLPEYIRLQGRVGVLTQFFSNSYMRNKKSVRENLLDDRSVWKEYISESWMENKLNIDSTLNANELSILRLCLDIQQWTKAIKPGGSLYQGLKL